MKTFKYQLIYALFEKVIQLNTAKFNVSVSSRMKMVHQDSFTKVQKLNMLDNRINTLNDRKISISLRYRICFISNNLMKDIFHYTM